MLALAPRPRRRAPSPAAFVAGAATLLLLLAGPALAQQGEPLTANVLDEVAAPGADVGIEGKGWERGTEVEISFDGSPVATTVVRDEGSFSTQITIPEDAAAGQHTIEVTGTSEEGEPSSLRTSVAVDETQTPRGWLVTLIVVALVVLAILVLAGLFLNRRRGTTGPPEEGGPSTQEPAPTPGTRQPRRP